ncbi:hypothetical protein ACH5RR_026171 [Cinchona calisaya]|uniref:Uncharacterized protein n=1 Tax=Cinchona calisaya TaxID=153742 RepID=A0ABD2Z2W0_9GENT
MIVGILQTLIKNTFVAKLRECKREEQMLHEVGFLLDAGHDCNWGLEFLQNILKECVQEYLIRTGQNEGHKEDKSMELFAEVYVHLSPEIATPNYFVSNVLIIFDYEDVIWDPGIEHL